MGLAVASISAGLGELFAAEFVVDSHKDVILDRARRDMHAAAPETPAPEAGHMSHPGARHTTHHPSHPEGPRTMTKTMPAPLPVDLEQLDDDTLLAVLHEANRVYDSRVKVKLPAAVLKAATDVLAEVEPNAPAPTTVVFSTTSWDDGYGWDGMDPKVILADGSVREPFELDSDGHLRGLLADHADANDLDADSVLRVSFNPPRVELNP